MENYTIVTIPEELDDTVYLDSLECEGVTGAIRKSDGSTDGSRFMSTTFDKENNYWWYDLKYNGDGCTHIPVSIEFGDQQPHSIIFMSGNVHVSKFKTKKNCLISKTVLGSNFTIRMVFYEKRNIRLTYRFEYLRLLRNEPILKGNLL